MASVFSMIIAGDIPGRFVWRDEVCVAFLSINPLAPGHTLVVPRVEVDHFDALDEDIWAHCQRVAQRIAVAQKAAFSPARIGMAVAGFEVPHVHIHVFPTRSLADHDWKRAATSVSDAEFDDAAARLRAALTAAGHNEVVTD